MIVTSRRKARQSGMVNIMLLFILSMIVLVPTVGLAIDCTMMYVTRTRLQAAADAAALAAGRALTVNQPLATQTAYAQARATAFFNANFPNNFMLSSNATVTVDAPYYGTGVNDSRTLYTNVHGSASAPLFFMRYMVPSASTILSFAQSARRDINVIMVLDKSGSMNGTPCTTMVQSAQNFVNYFSPGRDTLGLISFDASYSLDYAPTSDFMNPSGTLQAAIGNITCGGNTGTAVALNQAYTQIQAINQPAALNVIVLFTDGQPNGVVADYPIRRSNNPDVRYGTGRSDPAPGGCGSTSTNTLCSYPKSTCLGNTTTMRGSMGEWNGGPWATGTVAGALNWVNNENTIAGPGGCYYNNFGNQAIRRDIAYIPPTDIFGNLTSGYRTDYVAVNNGTGSYVPGSDKFPAGHPYHDNVANAWLRPDTPSAISNASMNAADDQASKIRSNSTFGILIYAIGLGGNPGLPPDTEFMLRVTNVPSGYDPVHNSTITNPIYNSALPTGMYQYVSTPTELNSAFAQLASSILRLNQ